jgi:peptidyl-prolyl cis-trans isomerase C
MDKHRYFHHTSLLTLLILMGIILWGCNSKKEDKRTDAKPAMQKSDIAPLSEPPVEMTESTVLLAASTVKTAKSPAVAVEVNGIKFTDAQLDTEVKRKLALLKDKMPADRLKQMSPQIRKQTVDDFIIRTLLTQEVNRSKIVATEQEVNEEVEKVKSSLPRGAAIEDLIKNNGMSMERFREEMSLGIKINKLVLSQPLSKKKPTDKEITKYYQNNKEKFKAPETVHVRHILVAKNAGDDEKAKMEKKAKAELLRKQLLDGSDFADLAAKNSDCPSKTSGGDLGYFPRGRMVKPFEDAAFSQKVNSIGPVVETDFGYHIIQVMEHNDARVITLDGNIKKEIGLFLEQQKRQEAFAELLKKLKAKATIIVAEQ